MRSWTTRSRRGSTSSTPLSCHPVPPRAETQGRTEVILRAWLKPRERGRVIGATKIAALQLRATWASGSNLAVERRISKPQPTPTLALSQPGGMKHHPFARGGELFDTPSLFRQNREFRSEGFPSGQREQTVNLPAMPSKVRILPPPPVSSRGASERRFGANPDRKGGPACGADAEG
jgi:hypothetical protein